MISADLVDHVALGVPAFVSHIAVDLDKLLQDRTVAPGALCGKPSRVVVMAVHVAFVLVIRILRPKERGAHRAGEVVHMELLV